MGLSIPVRQECTRAYVSVTVIKIAAISLTQLCSPSTEDNSQLQKDSRLTLISDLVNQYRNDIRASVRQAPPSCFIVRSTFTINCNLCITKAVLLAASRHKLSHKGQHNCWQQHSQQRCSITVKRPSTSQQQCRYADNCQ